MVVDQIVRSGSRAPNLHGQAASLASRTDVEQEFALFCDYFRYENAQSPIFLLQDTFHS